MRSAPVQRTSGRVTRVQFVSRLRWIAPTLLVAAGVVTVVAVVATTGWSAGFVALVAVGGVLYLGMLLADRRLGGLTLGPVVAVAALTGVLLIAVAPRTSLDLWMYAVYGRMAALHIDPWTHVPATLAGDPVLQRVGTRWITMPSMYGPAMVWLEPVASPIVGSSFLA